MTRAEIEEILRNLAETERHLQVTRLLLREAADHIRALAEDRPPREAVATTGGNATIATTPAAQDILYRLPEVIAITGQGGSTVYRHIVEGTFPGPVRLGAKSVAWRKSEIDRWIAARPSTAGGGRRQDRHRRTDTKTRARRRGGR